MSGERAEYHTTGPDKLLPPLDQTLATHRLARNIEAARKSGALFFLAAHLGSLLEEFQAKNGLITTVELEVLVTVAARAMVGK